jgi:hypothetical protein
MAIGGLAVATGPEKRSPVPEWSGGAHGHKGWEEAGVGESGSARPATDFCFCFPPSCEPHAPSTPTPVCPLPFPPLHV